MPNNLQRILNLLLEAPAAERDAILDRECGADAELRKRLAAMVAAGKEVLTGATIDVPPSPAFPSRTTPAPAIAEGPGTLIGPYKLLQQIGEGGFGSVFMAEQEHPVRRRVALKIIKLGMDTRAVIARFEAERQALAMMDHPNIAKVLDAGATDAGRPFFVMELCKGDPITAFADKHNLGIRERLELFEQVCQAVQHAHTKGVIHRDLKPSNILVSQQDTRPNVKVIDFGIAKATASKLTEKTLFTEHRQLIGTPEYMSPEQAEGSLDIDTRTDVYSLGVLLYELLTGSTPFDSKSLRSAAYAEIQRIIREVEPPRPSTRLSQSTESITAVAAHRHTEPRRLNTIIRGELDWIVMKALEKDRTRRYETANGLAMDIRRYLSGQAVLAAPPSTAYRLRKFVKRHRPLVFAASAVAVALVLGLAGTIWQASIASHQRDVARIEATRATIAETETRRRAEDLQKVADFQGQMLAQVDPTTAGLHLAEDVRTRYDAALEKASVAESDRPAQVEAFVGQWSRVNATDTALTLIDQTILKPAAAAIDKQFADKPAVAARLRHVLAERYHDLGLDKPALALEQQALDERRRVLGDDHPDTLLSLGNLAVYTSALGNKDDAELFYRDALDRSRRVRPKDDPETLVCVANMGALFMDKGQLDQAQPYFREALDNRRRILGDDDPDTLASINDWAMLLQAQGKLAEAEPFYRESVSKRRRILGEDHPKTLASTNDLAVLMRSQGKLEESISLFREVLDKKRRILGETHPSTLSSMQSFGAVLDAAGKPDEAEALMREALTKQQKLLGPDHASTLITLGNFTVYLINRNKLAEAEPLARETLDRRRRTLGNDHTATLIACNVMGLVLVRQGKLAEGEEYWRTAQETSKRTLGPAHPETLTYTQNLGGLAVDQKDLDKAEKLYREVVELGTPDLKAEHPIVVAATRRLGFVLNQKKQFAEAADLLARAEPGARKAYTGANARLLAVTLKDLATARAGLNQFAAAEPSYLEAHGIFLKTRGESHKETLECAQAIADFYSTWDKAEPGKGYEAKAAEWKAKAPPEPAPAK